MVDDSMYDNENLIITAVSYSRQLRYTFKNKKLLFEKIVIKLRASLIDDLKYAPPTSENLLKLLQIFFNYIHLLKYYHTILGPNNNELANEKSNVLINYVHNAFTIFCTQGSQFRNK